MKVPLDFCYRPLSLFYILQRTCKFFIIETKYSFIFFWRYKYEHFKHLASWYTDDLENQWFCSAFCQEAKIISLLNLVLTVVLHEVHTCKPALTISNRQFLLPRVYFKIMWFTTLPFHLQLKSSFNSQALNIYFYIFKVLVCFCICPYKKIAVLFSVREVSCIVKAANIFCRDNNNCILYYHLPR